MKYLNFILTVIAILLMLLVFQQCVNPVKPGIADSIQAVNIKQIGGHNIYDKILEVSNE